MGIAAEYQPVIMTTSGLVFAIARPISGTSRPVKDWLSTRSLSFAFRTVVD
jgi:hypothetical protein